MKLDRELEKILQTMEKAGFEVAIVGGAVRNALMGKRVGDWDLATNAKPEEILKLFKNAHYNNNFGTVSVESDGSKIAEITTYRSESAYSDSRHPDEVTWGKTLEEDLARRDFTVNAMALKKVESGEFRVESNSKNFQFTLVDLYKGQEDLKNKLIRTVGEPEERFGEDALRLMRAVRFATVLGFEIETQTSAAIAKMAPLISKISGERIRDELFKIVASDNCAEGIMMLRDTGILTVILPELEICFAVEQKSPKRHHVFDVGTHCVLSMKYCPSDDELVRFATLLHDVGKAKVAKVTEEGVRTFYNHEVVGGKIAKAVADRFHLSRNQKEKLYLLVRWHQFSVNEDQTDAALRRFIKNIGRENIDDMMALRVGDRLGGGLQQPESWRLKLFKQRLVDVMKKPFTVADLKVSGNDVMKELGIKPGPKVGEVLNKLFEEVAKDARKNTRAYLLKKLRELS